MKSYALILAGGDISSRMSAELRQVHCPALLPLHLSTVGKLNINIFKEEVDQVYLVVDEENCSEVKSHIGVDDRDYMLVGVAETQGVVDSLEQSLLGLSADIHEDDLVHVNLVTTVPLECLKEQGVCVSEVSTRVLRHCSLIHFTEGDWKVIKKADREADDTGKAFTGYFTAKYGELVEAANSAKDRKDLASVVSHLKAHAKAPFAIKEQDWVDCGHEINYLKARSMYLSSRSFNRLSIDLEKGVIQKRSEKGDKMEAEANYYDLLPQELKIFFPRLSRRLYSGEGAVNGYELEYYAYPTLAEYALYWNLSEDSWWMAFERLNQIVSQFRSYPTSMGPKAYHDALVSKTQSRLDSYLNSLTPEERNGLLNQPLTINGKKGKPLAEMIDPCLQKLESLYREDAFSAVHGDLCYNNILYSPSGALIKLIDPRGSYGDNLEGIYGDYRYDLAKLQHSVEGGYDALVNGYYTLQSAGNTVDLNYVQASQSEVTSEAMSWMLGQQKACSEDIKLIMASLFLSMIPLHADCAKRQKAFLINGIKILNEIEL